MTSQILDYVTVGTALASVLHAVWNLVRLAGQRRQRQRVVVPAGTGVCNPAALTVEMLNRGLPAGTAVYYEGPDGCRLTVWRTPEPSGHRAHGTEPGLW
ncbi:hypothetical protein AB0K68_24520 [Streptomyces sp. NPDC050698]